MTPNVSRRAGALPGVDAFEQFFEREYWRVHRSLVAALGDVGAADEAAQEAFVKAWLRWSRVGRMERAAAWVYVVAVRRALRRRTSAREEVADDANGVDRVDDRPAGDMADNVVARLDAQRLLMRLTERQRLVLVLRYYADLQLDEIAEAVGISVGTVKSTVHDALARLRVDVDREAEVI